MFAKVTRLNRIAYGEITGDISGCRRSFLRKSRADGRIESIFMCRHRTKSAGTKHIKAHRLFFLLVLFFGAGISFIFLCGQSKALNVGERSLPAFLCYLEYMLKKKNKS